jgi:dihydroorotase
MKLPAGRLEEGCEADFILIDPDQKWQVDPSRFCSKSRNSSFVGETLRGRVVATFRGGRLTYRQDDTSVSS